MNVAFDTSDIPAVAPGDLMRAARLWLREMRPGPVAIVSGGQGHHQAQTLERRVVDLFGPDRRTALAVVLRLRCLMAAAACRRFETHVRTGDEEWIAVATAAAAGMRVNAAIGFSPVRLAWAIAAERLAGAVVNSDVAEAA